MLKAIFIYIIFSLFCFAQAKTLKLLSIPLNDGTSFTYTVDVVKECSFKGVTDVEVPSFEQVKKLNIILTKINFLQKKLNLDIDEQEISPEKITFSLTGSTNIFFEFFFKKIKKSSKCELVKVIHVNDKKYDMDHIDVDYTDTLGTPVLKNITIVDKDKSDTDVLLYPWQLRGQISTYELNIGPALNIHGNIRVNNKNLFERTDPAIQPIPAFFFRYGPAFINKNGIGSLLFHKGNLSILGMGLLEGEPYSAPGLQEREQGAFFGSIIKYRSLEFTYYRDFINAKGMNFKVNLAPEFYFRISWKFSPQFYVQYWNDKYVDYYFGVKADEAVSGFPIYKGTNTINYGTVFEVQHYVERWTFVGDIGAKFYGDEVTNSPTVSKKTEFKLILSALYKVF
jgi:hypothetical protein